VRESSALEIIRWVCACGARLDLPVNGSGEATCACGLSYTLANGVVTPVE